MLCFHIWTTQNPNSRLSFQVLKRSLSDWFGSKCKCKVSSYLIIIPIILLHYKPNLRFDMSYFSFLCKFCTFRFILFYIVSFLVFFIQEWVNQIKIFLFSKMDLTTVSAQLVSIVNAKLWKVAIICENNLFPNFQAPFLKMCLFEGVTFFSRFMLIQSNEFFSESTYLKDSSF